MPGAVAAFDRHLPALYLVAALLITSLLSIVTAPFFAPDEANQACRALSIADGHFVIAPGDGEPGAYIDQGAYDAMDAVNDIRQEWERQSPNVHDRLYGPMTAQLQREPANIRWAHRKVFVPFGNTAVYPPLLYLPAIAGWRIGEATDLTIFDSLRLARFCSALAAVLVGWLALFLFALPRWRLLPFLLLPSTLFLNASCSQDALLLSLAALIAALLSRPLAAHRDFTTAETTFFGVVLALCATARPPYLALSLLLFVPRVELGAATWKRFLRPAIGLAAVFTIAALWRHLVAPLGIDTSDIADPELQQLFMLKHPFLAGSALLHGTASAALDFMVRGVYVIGWNDLLPHHGASAALGICLAVIMIAAPAAPIRTWRARLLLAFAILAPLAGISLAEFLIWTAPGAATVYGIQPRYWLPVLPLVMMLWPRHPRWHVPQGFVFAAIVVLTLIACTLPWVASQAFYRGGLNEVLTLNLP